MRLCVYFPPSLPPPSLESAHTGAGVALRVDRPPGFACFARATIVACLLIRSKPPIAALLVTPRKTLANQAAFPRPQRNAAANLLPFPIALAPLPPYIRVAA